MQGGHRVAAPVSDQALDATHHTKDDWTSDRSDQARIGRRAARRSRRSWRLGKSAGSAGPGAVRKRPTTQTPPLDTWVAGPLNMSGSHSSASARILVSEK